MVHRSASYVLLSLVLWLSLTAASATTTLTVNLTSTEEGTNGALTVPQVCSVVFLLGEGYSADGGCSNSQTLGDNCTVDVAGDVTNDSLSMTFRKSRSEPITFFITFDPSMRVSCSEYTPHTNINNLQELPFTCHPLYACNSTDSSDVTVVWRKFFDYDTLRDFIDSPENESSEYNNYTLYDTNGGSYYPPMNISVSGQARPPRTKMSLQEDGQVLNISSSSNSPGPEALGYYIPTIVTVQSDNSSTKGPYRVVYLDPELERHSHDSITIIQGTDKGRDYTGIHCVFRSFPPATVTWDVPGKSMFEPRNDTGETSETFLDLHLTYFSHLFFEEVQYDDAGKYRCRGDNGVSSVKPTHTATMRVRNPLRPLWPALGIVCSLLITAMFILGGSLVDKCRGKRTQDDDDEGAFKRNYSVISSMGEENNNNNLDIRRGHLAGKRLSSATQELLPNELR